MKSKTLSHGVDMNKIKQGAIASAVITASLLSSGCSSSGSSDERDYSDYMQQAVNAIVNCSSQTGVILL